MSDGMTEAFRDTDRWTDDIKRAGDLINSPEHYALFPDMEAIEAMRRVLSVEEYRGYLKGCSLKYRLRAGKKDDTLKDIAKAMKYEEFLKEFEEECKGLARHRAELQ
ncbi:MAG: DUF3310 domain-containing protein [Phycisphaerales bacterium]|nr:DUF3310 domain-containing protein [Phycisphaerales bacterium]